MNKKDIEDGFKKDAEMLAKDWEVVGNELRIATNDIIKLEEKLKSIQEENRKQAKEELSSLVHEIWANWMKYIFDNCDYGLSMVMAAMKNGTPVIPYDLAERWTRQINTDYKDLSDDEKKSDQDIAEKILNLLEKYNVLNN